MQEIYKRYFVYSFNQKILDSINKKIRNKQFYYIILFITIFLSIQIVIKFNDLLWEQIKLYISILTLIKLYHVEKIHLYLFSKQITANLFISEIEKPFWYLLYILMIFWIIVNISLFCEKLCL